MGYRVGAVCSLGTPAAAGGRSRNEDSFLHCQHGVARSVSDGAVNEDPIDGDGVLVGVFDGLGGHDDGHVASATAARVLARLYQPGAPNAPARVLLQYVRQAQETLYLRARGPDGRVRMGTTLTVAWLLRGVMHWIHVGDSRLYLVRAGEGLRRLTEDHTRNAFRRRDGKPAELGADHLSQSFIFGSRGLGHDAELRIEAGRDLGSEPLDPGDRLLLCTDGLTSVVTDARIAAILGAAVDPDAAAADLVAEAIALGTRDNVTVVVIFVDADPDEDLIPWGDDGEDTVQF